jgi:RNA polymerase sigma factor (sigma-70 family)
MARTHRGQGWGHLRQLFGAGTAVGLTDQQLLELLVCGSGQSDFTTAAFETLLARHGSMVLAVCRQVLGDPHAVEDAFQATFLVLVRQAGSLRMREGGSLGPWLHGVAYRTAMKSRKISARRQVRERRVAAAVSELSSTPTEFDDLRFLVHEEVNRLPTKYRAPVVLCYFEGRTHDEAAAALHWPVGTVRGRLARARDLLRARLTRRGLAPGVLVGTSWFEQSTRVEVTAPLRDATVAAVTKGVPVGSGVAALTSVVLRSLLLARMKIMAAIALAITLLATGAGFIAPGGLGVLEMRVIDAAPVAKAVNELAPPVDRFGDPLPKHARARLGSMRFRHGDGLSQALYTPDGQFVVSAGGMRAICVWNAATGQKLHEFGDFATNFWDPVYGEKLHEAGEFANGFQEIALSPDGKTLAVIEALGGPILRELPTGKEQRRWHKPKNEVYRHLGFSPDGRCLAAGADRIVEGTAKIDKFISVWDTTAGTERRRSFQGDWGALHELEFSPDGKSLATASYDTTANDAGEKPEKGSTRIWDVATGTERQRFSVEGCSVLSVAFSPDGKWLAAGVSDGAVRLYDLATGHERAQTLRPKNGNPPPPRPAGGIGDAREPIPIPPAPPTEDTVPPPDGGPAANAPPGPMNRLKFSPNGSILAGGSRSLRGSGPSAPAAIYLWDVARGEELRHFRANQGAISSLDFSADGKTLVTTGGDFFVRIWDVTTGKERLPEKGHHSSVHALAISPADGTVFTSGDGTVRQWDPLTGRELGIAALPVVAMAFAPDGKTLLLSGGYPGLRIWSVAERREVRRLSAREGDQVRHVGSFLSTAYSSDGKEVITVGEEGIRIRDVVSDKEVRWAVRASIDGSVFALSPDVRIVATGAFDELRRTRKHGPAIHLWELASGQEVETLKISEDDTGGLAFSPDGRFLAACCNRIDRNPRAQAIRLWDTALGHELRQFKGHSADARSVAFTADGRSVVSASGDGTALVWDVSDLPKPPIAEPLTADTLKNLWDELASADARVAYRASWALSVPSAVAFLGDRLSSASTQAQKRSVVTEGAIGPPEVLRTIRAVAAIERVGTPDARRALERLADGDPDALNTEEARSALIRLKARRN